MLPIIYITSIIFIFGCSNEIFVESKNHHEVYSNAKKSKTELKPRETGTCPIVCSNGVNNTVVVLTAVDELLEFNVHVSYEIMAMVYYKCNKYITEIGKARLQYHTFQTLCENRTDDCKNYDNSFLSQWESIKRGKNYELFVNIHLPDNIKEVRIKTQKCDETEPINFRVENKDIVNEAGIHKFLLRKDDELSIKISLTKYNEENIADIIFNVTRSKCVVGWQVKTDNRGGYKCFITMDNKTVEGGYKSWRPCPEHHQQFSDYCQELHFVTPKCSYICALSINGALNEGGYIIRKNHLTYPEQLGSGHWTKDDLPLSFALFNECEYGFGICEGGNSFCKDQVKSYSCSSGSYNLTECLLRKVVSPYWRCPVDNVAISIALRSPDLLNNKIDSSFYMSLMVDTFKDRVLETIEELTDLYNIIRLFCGVNGSASFNLSIPDKQFFATFLLNTFLDSYYTYMDRHTDQPLNNSLYYYAQNIPKDLREVVILMPVKSNTSYSVTVRLVEPDQRSDRNLRVQFSYFQDVDLMNEIIDIQRMTESVKYLHNGTASSETKTGHKQFFRNSLLFSLKVNNISAFKKVEFKLQKFVQVERTSWLYEVDANVCGSLNDRQNWSWTTDGCTWSVSKQLCKCNHLSNFAMLISLEKINVLNLYVIEKMSLIGASIATMSLLLFILFILFINAREKLRIDQLNIAICLLLGTTIFMCGCFFYQYRSLCSVVALTTQFLFLSAFSWKLIFGINVFKLITSFRYPNDDWLVKYRYMLFLLGYCPPLIIVFVSGGLYFDHYGAVSRGVCWIDPKHKAFYSFIIPICIIIALNTFGLFVIGFTLFRNYIRTRKTRMNESNELFVFVQLLVSMGLTWLPVYFAVEYLFAVYIFVIFFPLQGLLMFLIVVVINKENRGKVSSFIATSFHSLTPKLSIQTDEKTITKSKEYGLSKKTELSDNILCEQGGTQREDNLSDKCQMVWNNAV